MDIPRGIPEILVDIFSTGNRAQHSRKYGGEGGGKKKKKVFVIFPHFQFEKGFTLEPKIMIASTFS